MSDLSCIDLKNLHLPASIGTYAANESVPDSHVLDLTLWIDPSLVLVDADRMSLVFDYDPLLAEIERLATDGHYETQERLMTRIVIACAQYESIEAVDIALLKSPVRNGSGSVGVRARVDRKRLRDLRDASLISRGTP